jgi:hypothetical protein
MCEGYRQRLHVEWRKKYTGSTMDEQRVRNQLNSIIRGKMFSVAELEDLKREERGSHCKNPPEEDEEEQSDSEPEEVDETEEAERDTH